MIPFGNPMIGHNGGPKIDDVFATDLANGSSAGQTVPISIAAEMSWNKVRNTTGNHALLDIFRPNGVLITNSTVANTAYAGSGSTPDGIKKTTVVNNSGNNVIWSFRRARRFFDIVTYTGDGSANRVINHNLGIAPGFVIVKSFVGVGGWAVGALVGSTIYQLRLDDTAASGTTYGTYFASLTASNFTLAGSSDTNVNGRQYVAYVFGNDPLSSGFIKTGIYTGNGSNTGPIVNLGWEPQWILLKRTDTTGTWITEDSKRFDNSNGSIRQFIQPNSNSQEGGAQIDFTLTGFQPKNNLAYINGSGGTFVYMAIRKGKN